MGTAGQFLRRNTANTAYEFRTLQGGDIAGSELTFTNDTNVQMTLGGTPATALLQPVTINLGWTGQLAVGRGGTGASTLTGVVIGNGTSAMTSVSGTAGQLLRRNAANTAYEFFTASLLTGNGVADRLARWTSATNLIDSLIVDNGSNIGIGDPAPTVLIDAYKSTFGIIRVRADNGGAFYVANSLKTSTIAAFGDAGGIIGSAVNTIAMMFAGNVPLVFYVNGSERARFTTTGDFGIGTNSPAHKLDVNGNVNVNGTTYSNYLQLPSANYITFGSAYSANIPSITGTSGTGAFLSFHPSGSSSGEKMRLSDSGQLRLNGYTSTSSFTGIVQGYLAFTSGGNIITTATPGGVSGTQNYLAKFDSTGIAVGNSRIVDDGTNFLLNGASSVVTGLNLVGSISATDTGGGVIILRRDSVPSSGNALGIIDGWGITTGSTYVWGGGIEIRASQAWNSTSAGTEIAIATTPDNTTSATDMFVFLNNGSVRFIGRTSNPIGVPAGTMYYNSSANNMRYYNGTSWITF